MGVWSKMLLNAAAFAATTQDLNVPADFIKYLDIHLAALSTGAITKPEYKAGLPRITAKLGGIQIVNLSLENLIALNSLWLGRSPLLRYLGQTADYLVVNGPARLPLYIVKKGRELSCQFEFADMANADNEELSVRYRYKDTPFPERSNLHYAYETFTNVGAPSVRTNISRAGSLLVGLLINDIVEYGADQDAGDSPNVSELDLIVDNRVVHSDNWLVRGDEIAPHNPDDDASQGVQHVEDSWISFEEEPWPADKIWAITKNTALFGEGTPGTTAYEMVAVYIEP